MCLYFKSTAFAARGRFGLSRNFSLPLPHPRLGWPKVMAAGNVTLADAGLGEVGLLGTEVASGLAKKKYLKLKPPQETGSVCSRQPPGCSPASPFPPGSSELVGAGGAPGGGHPAPEGVTRLLGGGSERCQPLRAAKPSFAPPFNFLPCAELRP